MRDPLRLSAAEADQQAVQIRKQLATLESDRIALQQAIEAAEAQIATLDFRVVELACLLKATEKRCKHPKQFVGIEIAAGDKWPQSRPRLSA